MTTWQIVLAALEGLGAALTLLGLVLLFTGARNRYRNARRQLDRALKLRQEEADERARTERADVPAMIEKYRALHEQNGLPRPAGYGDSYQPGYESVNIMHALGNGAARDLVIASLGVALSGVAGVLANLYPVAA